ncbi:MAG: 1-acyl-sn-glycerol-3-phosphate acyltransferase [Snodgrassella sp.]|uniref:lysophospholipid acyltransferase family protein n=1 Tax=Snodgrassella TaxID=1193515 RepID=UPI001EF63B53|nr:MULTISPECIES: lysophospholipid acyltransferase family protein [Snodgrassella]MCO6508387.1 1-acyl-sn-glycerol-3-phosphate acyltransferase [Snodgrassella sp.]MCO6512881.1 1-acyl-sn-glycerol-3-phosphate acyltransferase [Snodgrassella sp.]MCO6519679.1 1-acyl-sn-glycerol-3-phosphate acyltransferase [Snodgrassella sp.]
MLLLRNLIYWFVLCVFSLLWLEVVLISMLIPKGVTWTTTAWAKVLFWMLEHVIGLKYEVIGRENIPHEPAIVCCKHQSGWETLAMLSFFPDLAFVAKRELFRIPIFGWALKWRGTIGIDRKNPKAANAQIISQGKICHQKGMWICIFPEGTRIKPGYRGYYKKGAARMAQQLHMHLVPVALNSGEFWPKDSFLKYPGKVTVVIGTPIHYDAAQTPEELIKLCEQWIENQQIIIQGVGPFAPQNPQTPTPLVQH